MKWKIDVWHVVIVVVSTFGTAALDALVRDAQGIPLSWDSKTIGPLALHAALAGLIAVSALAKKSFLPTADEAQSAKGSIQP